MTPRILLASLALLATAACSTVNEMVPVKLPDRDVVRLDNFNQIHYVDFLSSISGYEAKDLQLELRRYVQKDLAAALGKPVQPLEAPYWPEVKQVLERCHMADGFVFNDNRYFANLFQSHPASLFLLGKLKIDVKTVSTIGEVRDAAGHKRNDFIQKQIWQMEMKMQLIDSDSGRPLLENDFKEKLDLNDPAAFQLSSLFDRAFNRLTIAVQRREKPQQRYILYK
jgi:hypothetical protein